MRRLTDWLPTLVAAAALLVSAAVAPGSLPGLPLCWFKAMTGHPCPGCGLTHSFSAIGHGQFAAAWAYNPFGYLFYAIAVAMLFWPLLRRLRPDWGDILARPRFLAWAVPTLVAAMWAFGLWRIFGGA